MPNRSVACSNPECGKRFVDIIGEGTIDIVRRGQSFVITGQDFSMIGTCFACGQKTSLTVRGGKLDETDIKFREPKLPTEDNPQPNDDIDDPTSVPEDINPLPPEPDIDDPTNVPDPVHKLTTVK
jgi:hypothetical protein